MNGMGATFSSVSLKMIMEAGAARLIRCFKKDIFIR
jgi:hypothetical protein